MENTLKKASLTSFLWTIILIVLLACFTIVILISSRKADVVSSNINTLKTDSADYKKLDTCISILYDAENNSRLFVLTLDSVYHRKYTLQLSAVSEILGRFEEQQKKRSSHLSGLVRRKRVNNQEFVDLKIMVDSLLFYTLQDVPGKIEKPFEKPGVVRKIKKIIQKDSVLTVSKRTRKGLLKRIAEAIANKEAEDSSVLQLAKRTEISRDSLFLPSVKASGIPDLYNQFNAARRELNEREKQLLAINGRIFASLQVALLDLKIRQQQESEIATRALLEDASVNISDVRDLSVGSVAVVLILALIIVWNLVRLYKKERTIIDYAELTAETTKKKGVFMAQVAHEIRTPLNSVIGFSQLIDTQNMDESLKINVNAIKSSSRILLTLVNEILDFSKFESGKITLLNKRILPLELLNDATSILSVLAAEKEIKIATSFDFDSKLMLIGDDFRIKQIVINLLTNAVKFTPKKGSVSISSTFEKNNSEKGILTIKVKDSGVGIEPENQQKIFDDFIQIEMIDTSSRHLGTGLGLAICKKITDLYGGDISVKSAPGAGSEFTVRIPLDVAKDSASEAEAVKKNNYSSFLKGKKVLIADDAKINLVLISRIMDKHLVSYDLAANGVEAYSLFENNQYDLIITDIQMPEMDGIELTKRVRAHSDIIKSHIPVLGFTGSSNEENRTYFASVGMNDILGKPFEEQDLIAVLSKLF
ncbi:ATP-binding protein [Dyadobacter psychrotolerans]|uniref:histidine kinase n=1 Tax=Dyadobacter psychrotolerans TaxID=2541721 RepID=A0A4R5DK05_9BACT|nr:ATP-binding protein [Dyadobacter psychrotolerans]TDE14472.1 response regulator [Dyadobacter psychrotolerans]